MKKILGVNKLKKKWLNLQDNGHLNLYKFITLLHLKIA